MTLAKLQTSYDAGIKVRSVGARRRTDVLHQVHGGRLHAHVTDPGGTITSPQTLVPAIPSGSERTKGASNRALRRFSKDTTGDRL